MARTNSVNFTGPLQYPMASAATDVFHKEDVQVLAQAVDQHDHTAGKGHSINTVPANASITAAMLASDTPRASLLVNGGFEIWQRGAGAFTANGFYTADRWLTGLDGSDTLSIVRDATNIDVASGNAAAATYVHGSGTGGTALYQQVQPNTDVWGVRGKSISLSVRVKTSTAGTVRAFINNNGTLVYSSYHTGDGTYQTLTVTATVAALPTTLNIGVNFGTSSNTAYLDNAMLVVGSVPADYAPLHPADDLARCLRYYQRWQPVSVNALVAPGYAYAATGGSALLSLQGKFAVTPTCTFSALADWGMATGAGAAQACTAISGTTYTTQTSTLALSITVASGLTAGQGGAFVGQNANSALMLEGNP